MTEKEWLKCRYPEQMLKFLRGKASDRKLRLFACACCQRIWTLITDVRSRAAVSATEQYAEGLISAQELDDACDEAHEYAEQLHASTFAAERAEAIANGYLSETDEAFGIWEIAGAVSAPAQAAACAAVPPGKDMHFAIEDVAERVAVTAGNRDPERYETLVQEERDKLSALLRDIFGNPFRPVALDPAWCTSDVVALAEGIYADRAFDRLPILADALQDAGCEHPDVLNHCRDTSLTHVRGCWVIDLLTGRQ
jgi:hypothetical protein